MKYTVQRTLTENFEVDATTAQEAFDRAWAAPLEDWTLIDGPEATVFDQEDEPVEDWEYPE